MTYRESINSHAARAGMGQNDERIRQHVEDVVCRLICEQSMYDKVELDKSLSYYDLDSLDYVELVMAVEDEFSIQIPDEDVEGKIHTGNDIVELLFKA